MAKQAEKDFRTPLRFKIKDNTYTINTPTCGELWDIEERKVLFSNGSYQLVSRTKTLVSEEAMDRIDMFSYLSVMCPQLFEDMKVNVWRELDPFDALELMAAYKEQFLPWFAKFDSAYQKAKEHYGSQPVEADSQ